MRLVGRFGLVSLGFVAGFMAAATVVRRVVPSRGDAESDEIALVAVFDGAELVSRSTAFRGGSMLAWYGGVDVDLREARLAEDAQLSVTALFGGIAIRVPPEWRIEADVRTIAGGVAVSGQDPDDPEAPLLTLDGVAAFGGVAISRTPRSESS